MQVKLFAAQLEMINQAIDIIIDQVHTAEKQDVLTVEILEPTYVKVTLCRSVFGTLQTFDFYVDTNTCEVSDNDYVYNN